MKTMESLSPKYKSEFGIPTLIDKEELVCLDNKTKPNECYRTTSDHREVDSSSSQSPFVDRNIEIKMMTTVHSCSTESPFNHKDNLNHENDRKIEQNRTHRKNTKLMPKIKLHHLVKTIKEENEKLDKKKVAYIQKRANEDNNLARDKFNKETEKKFCMKTRVSKMKKMCVVKTSKLKMINHKKEIDTSKRDMIQLPLRTIKRPEDRLKMKHIPKTRSWCKDGHIRWKRPKANRMDNKRQLITFGSSVLNLNKNKTERLVT
ncbi:unnamed protein product [Mytilus coruscus]|uniref:Uncharacterized protein n=1 Tax=Mytilus coruscus TaxID=42192 RepID=A0A6J8EQG7_MYTCO|nr:unnamed protein product [Mytilus coruscus]